MDQFLGMPLPAQLGVVIIACILILGIFRFLFNLFTLVFMVLVLWLGWVIIWAVVYISSLFKRRK